jgi:hypothetical protein
MPRITMTGKNLKNYSGVDSGEGRNIPLRLYPGMTSEVSDKKAEQLLKDYPLDFVLEGSKKEPALKQAEPDFPMTYQEPEEKPSGKVPKKNKAIAPKKNKKR